MFLARRFSRHEQAVVRGLQQAGLEGELTLAPRGDFSAELRRRLVDEAAAGCDERCRTLVGC